MLQMGYSRRFRDVGHESALPPKTDIVSSIGHVGKVPIAEVALLDQLLTWALDERPEIWGFPPKPLPESSPHHPHWLRPDRTASMAPSTEAAERDAAPARAGLHDGHHRYGNW
jgi:hypothetical protein